jgi:hypothetical protein
LLESAKGRFLGVAPPPPKLSVPPRVWYGTSFFVIRDAIESVSYSEAWGSVLPLTCEPHDARGACVGILSKVVRSTTIRHALYYYLLNRGSPIYRRD